MQLLEFSAKHVSAESYKSKSFTFPNKSKDKTCINEEMQPVAVEQTDPNTKKHRTYT